MRRRIQAGSTLSSAEYAAWYFWDGGVSSSSSASGLVKRRKRKKRKKRLPRTRCLPQGFAGGDAPRVMFPYVVVRPEMLCIMADMDQKDSTLCANLAVACVSLVLLVTLHPALCSFTLSSGSGCFASWPGRLRRTVMQLVSCLGLVLLVSLHLALCSFCFSARQAHCRPAIDARHHGRYGSEGQVVARSGMCTGGFTGYSAPRAVFLPCLQARDARHHGRYGPEGQLPRGVQKTRFYWEILLCFRIQRNAWTSCYMLCVNLRMLLGRISHIFSMKVGPWRLHRCSSWTRLSPWSSYAVQWRFRSCSSSSRSSTSLSVRRDSFPWSHFRDH